MINTFFITDQNPSLIVNGIYDPTLVTLSIATAIFAAYFSLYIIDLANKTEFISYQRLGSATGALVMSGGIWSMHFIGMLAFSLCTTVNYDPTLTFLSFLPAFLACYICFSIFRRHYMSGIPRAIKLALGSVLLGAGIGTMHYTGMAAMEMSPLLRYDPSWFSASIIVAVLLSFIGLYSRFHLSDHFKALSALQNRLICAIIFGFAVSGMHYMGMAATRFVATSPLLSENVQTSQLVFIAISVSFATVLLTTLVGIFNGMVRFRLLLAEKSAEESRLEAILSTAVDGIVTINIKGVILSFNKAAENIFGWQQHEVLGKNVKILMNDDIAAQHDDYLSNSSNHEVKKIIGVNRNVYAKHKHGHLFPIRLGLGEVKQPDKEPLFVGFITDLTEQRALQQSLEEKEKQYRTLMDNMPGAVFRCLLDENWSMLFISPSVLDLTGYSPDEFVSGRINFEQIIHGDDKQSINEIISNAAVNNTQYAVEYRIRHRNGKIIWLLEQGLVNETVDTDKKCIDGVLIDITARHEYEESLKQAKQEAEAAAHAKQSFMANMSHEIRTPMNAIIGFSDILMDSPLSKEQQKHIITVNKSARSLLHLLNEVLDSAKLEKGKLDIQLEHFNLQTLLDNIVSTFWLEAKRKNLLLDLKINDDVAPVYIGDEIRIRQVMNNLLGNAIKFTEQGSVTVSVSKTQNNQLFFEIKDTGIGIAKHRLNAIFQPFEQADGTMTRRFGGTGLGTTISKQLVELMGGTINVISDEGQGSCFYFTLPLQEGDAKQVDTLNHSKLTLPPLRILVVDDIEQNIELLKILLSQAGHTITTASNGFEAIAAFEKQTFDVILMDIHMPECDGLTACKKIRELEQIQQIKVTPIIALTASVLQQDKLTTKQAGMNGFANKPVDISQLNHEIAKVLGLDISTTHDYYESNDKKHINYDKGVLLWGSKEKLNTEIGLFLANHQHSILRLKGSTLSEAEQKSILHTLKGVAGNLALAKLLDLLTLAEKEREKDSFAALIDECEQEWRILYSQLGDLNQSKVDQPLEHAIPIGALIAKVNKLLTQAEHAEIDDELLNLVQTEAPAEYKDRVVEICAHFDNFDFDAAMQALTELKQCLLAAKEHK
ncbi:PAS domain S-box protein [Pseudoalteromonas sp. OFAV1]|uniref:PAS domain S-box protein n=1 Tax=Pseudoalteromonas sp. OFAV1 TaxID=2908892 RepID=UPI001F47B7F2|nr:PAS domain S-box protein [Pseudoalteromonas sp. OFAV1]MCF2902164.1 PAS domain S-box protein [Pseudoalteromonas sp. OFAV1]